jgi:hypothetical protein
MTERPSGTDRRHIRLWWVVAGTILVAAIAIASSTVLAAATVQMEPTMRQPVRVATATLELHVTDGNGDGQSPPIDTVLTSDLFLPRVQFKIAGAGGRGSEFCVWGTSDRTIVLGHIRGCVDDVRFIRPFATDCGIRDETPDAASFAAAILAKPAIGAVDRGGLLDGGVPETLFLGNVLSGRVIQMDGVREFDAMVDDPDRCRMLMDPNGEDDAVEIRGDLAARLVLFDVRGELVVIRAGLGGHDAVSGAAAHDRGYGEIGEGSREAIWHMLRALYAVRFE